MAHALEGGEHFSERAAALGERGAQLVLVGKQPLQATLSLIDVALELGHLLAGVDQRPGEGRLILVKRIDLAAKLVLRSLVSAMSRVTASSSVRCGSVGRTVMASGERQPGHKSVAASRLTARRRINRDDRGGRRGLSRPVKLLGKHHPDELMRPRHFAKSEAKLRLFEKRRTMAIGAADGEDDVARTAIRQRAMRLAKAGPVRSAETRQGDEVATTIWPLGRTLSRLTGRQDSAGLPIALPRWRDGGSSDVVFAIGGADGHGAPLLEKAELRLAFGEMTWPHQLVRVMLAEQLYRAVTILSGHPYHRD